MHVRGRAVVQMRLRFFVTLTILSDFSTLKLFILHGIRRTLTLMLHNIRNLENVANILLLGHRPI